jgi:regulator of sirC expression with transglutaminase-like and TPR domain
MDFPLARQAFYRETQQPDHQINLAKAALYLAQEEYPELDPDAYLKALDDMAEKITASLPAELYPLRIIRSINRYLFEELKFAGNADDYYDPRNSYFNQVIDRRSGIPITLSLVYLEIAKRINFPMVGVGMPGHFLIRPVAKDMEVFVDPFHQGEVMFPADCQERLSQIYGKPVELQPRFLETVTPRQFLVRMLNNLKMIYLNQRDLEKAVSIIERILLLMPDAVLEQRDRGLIYYRLGRWHEAKHDLEDYLAQVPVAPDSSTIRHLLNQMARQED